MVMVNSLKEFIGDESPARWGRSFYKYNDIGPWVKFNFLDTPEELLEPSTVIDVSGSKPVFEENIDEELASFIGADTDDNTEAFLKNVDDFWRDHPSESGSPYEAVSKSGDDKRLLRREWIDETHLKITMSWTKPAVIRSVYYEGEEIAGVNVDECIGITVGSIVEGSDAEGTPFTMTFPFDTDEFEKNFEALTEECKFYWDRDNSNWYKVQSEGLLYTVKECGGEWEFSGVPKQIQTKIKKMELDDLEYDEPVYINREWLIEKIMNDATFF